MDIWQRHARRAKKLEQFEQLNSWILANPRKARLWSLGIAILLCELAEFAQLALDAIVKHFQY